MGLLVLDSGNSIIKAKTANKDVVFPHALQPLTEGEYRKITSRASINVNSADYIRVNGKPYVICESAERHGVLVQRSGSARYTSDYYCILAVAALARLYERGREVTVFGSHVPADVKYREDLRKSVIGEWTVEVGKRETGFRVVYANTLDEPVGD